MKKVISFLLILMFAISMFVSPKLVLADVGEVPGKGGVITPGDKTQDVEMRSEKVVFDIKYQDDQSPFYSAEYPDRYSKYDQYAHMKADFEMNNQSSSDVSMDLMFPVMEIPFVDPYIYDEADKFNQSINYSIKVNGSETDYTHQIYKMPTLKGTEDGVHALSFQVLFEADSVTTISVEYDTRLINEPKSIYGSFNYVLETGSHWAGDIGSGEIVFRFPNQITSSVFSTYNDFFEIDGNELVWKFENLEPSQEHNIKVTYSPRLLERWKSKPEEVTSVNSFGDTILNTSHIPATPKYEGISMLGYWYSVEGNPLFLLDKQAQTPKHGWIAKFGKNRTPWVEFTFDGVYELDSLNVISGISSESYSTSGQTDAFYSLLSRPKKLTLVFSDSTSKVVSIEDTPSQLQVVNFDKVETSSVKVIVNEAYSGETKDENILGIGHMSFDIGNKTEQEAETQTNKKHEESSEAKQNNNLVLILVGSSCLLSVFALVGLIIFVKKVLRKKKKEEKKEEKKESA